MKRFVKRFFGTIGFWAGWPVWWALLRYTARTRVLCIYDDMALLVLPTVAMNRWSLPGGGIRRGENPITAACREIREELGISLRPATLHSLAVEPVIEESRIRYSCHYYAVVLADRPNIRLALEVADLRWVSLKNMDSVATQQVVRRALALWEAR